MKSWTRHILVFLINISLYSFATFSYAADDTPEKNTIKEKVQSAIKIKKNVKENKENQILETPSSTDTSTGQNDILGTTPLPDDSATETQTEEDTELTIEEKEKVKQELNAYIIDSYKAQWNKIMKELDAKLQKAIPDPDEREDAYKKILISLQLREKRINNMKAGETKKLILKEFLNHMITNIEKKIENIEK